MDNNPFSTVVVSNASLDTYKDNVTSDFRNALKEEKVLNGDWACAVSKVGYQKNFLNVTKNVEVVLIVNIKTGTSTTYTMWGISQFY